MRTFTALALIGLSLLPPGPAHAQTSTSDLYVLKMGSAFETGCFGPCLCPVVAQPMQGTFQLKQTSVDPLFTNYAVQDVRWTVPNSTQNLSITGSGTYKVGGEFAVQHQMVLDLSLGGGPSRRFDSGLIMGGGKFPNIDIKVSLHGEEGCVDTVLQVVASPATATSADSTGAALAPGIQSAGQNPFRDRARLLVTLPRQNRVSVDVLDVRGRAVRHLEFAVALCTRRHWGKAFLRAGGTGPVGLKPPTFSAVVVDSSGRYEPPAPPAA